MEIKKWLAAVLFLLGLPVFGFSGENQKSYYVDLTSGYFMYTQDDADYVENGPAFGISLGYRPDPSIGLEISYLGSLSDVSTNLFTLGGRLSGWVGVNDNHEFFVQGGLGGGFVSVGSVSEVGLATRFGFGYLYHGNYFAIGPSIAFSTLRQEEAASLFVSPLLTLTAQF